MALKRLLIWLVKNVLVLLLITLIFSSATLDFPEFVRGIFGDVFAYSSPEVQKEVVGKLTGACSSLERGSGIATLQQICTNDTLMSSMKENCRSYKELKNQGYKIENEEEMIQSCEQVESGELDAACKKFDSKSTITDFSEIGALCRDYQSGKLNGQDFFVGVVSSPLSGKDTDMSQMELLGKYNKTIEFLNKNIILFLFVLAGLIAVLYLLIGNMNLFILTLSGISLSLGALILVPYVGIIAYDKFVGIDASSILGSILGLIEFDFKAIISVILLLFLRTYNSFIISLGIILAGAGIGGKFYGKMLKSQGKIKESKLAKEKKNN